MSGYRVKDPNGNYVDLSDIYSLKPFGITYTGTMTSISDASYNYYIMTTNGTLTISNGFGIQFSYLAVGGGGGGGNGGTAGGGTKIGGGGGGAGFVKTGTLKTIINDTIIVSIGAGGTSNANGVNTTIAFQSNTYNNLNIDCSGGLFGKNATATGGNGGDYSSIYLGGIGGGIGGGGGGGGGYTRSGFNASSNNGGNGGTGSSNPLNGGAGAAIIISQIGCGGGGGGGLISGFGGSGGTSSSGGSGGSSGSVGTNATLNTGGGGGGGGGGVNGGSGGSGLFVIAIHIS